MTTGNYNIEIPELNRYFGAKFGGGMYQNIINLIPPHKAYFELFGGSLAVFRNKKPALYSHLNDLSSTITPVYLKHFNLPNIKISNLSAIPILQELESLLDPIDSFIYLDPPYIKATRRSIGQYSHEMSDDDHRVLLDIINHFRCNVMISHYPNHLYDLALANWNTKSFKVMTRHGWQTEKVYFNYEVPTKLHDYSYLGNNFTDRQRIKRKALRLKSKLSRLPELERAALIDMIKNDFIDSIHIAGHSTSPLCTFL